MNFEHSKTYTLDMDEISLCISALALLYTDHIVYDDDGNIIRGHVAIQIEELIHRLKEVLA